MNKRADDADDSAAAYELAATSLENLQVDLFFGQPSTSWWTGTKAHSVGLDIDTARRAVNAEVVALRNEALQVRGNSYAWRAQAWAKAVQANDLDAAVAAAATGPS